METHIGYLQRLKLSLAMLVGAVVALIQPQEVQRALDDHLEAAKRRLDGSSASLPALGASLSEVASMAQSAIAPKDQQSKTRIDYKQRLKLSLAMLVGAVVALIQPQEVQRALDDHLEAAKRRLLDPRARQAKPKIKIPHTSPMAKSLVASKQRELEAPMLYRDKVDNGLAGPKSASGSIRVRFTARELEAVTLAANIARRKDKTIVQANHPITVEDSRAVINAFLVHLAMRSQRSGAETLKCPEHPVEVTDRARANKLDQSKGNSSEI